MLEGLELDFAVSILHLIVAALFDDCCDGFVDGSLHGALPFMQKIPRLFI